MRNRSFTVSVSWDASIASSCHPSAKGGSCRGMQRYHMSGWYYLLLGGLLEIVWAISTKARPWWTLYISIGAGAGSVSCLYAALETMPIGTAYAVWTGIGAAGSALVGIGLFGESASALRLGSLALVTVGLIGIGLSSR